MKPKILFLTNWQNGAPEEDRLLLGFLSRDFELIAAHPCDCLPLLGKVKGIIIRNIWPVHEYQEDWDDIKTYIRDSDLPVYNPLTFKGDVDGKDYIVVLYNKGYPVIPSIDRMTDFEKLPPSDYYWIKPKKSCDGIGAEKLSKAALFEKNPHGYLIQPFVEFEYEPSFFYIDNIFHHALREKHRLTSDNVDSYDPTFNDLDFANRFVQWTDIAFGVERIDAVRMKDGRLLLTEIEDLCPYLYLSEMGEVAKGRFLTALRESMLNVFSTNRALSYI